MLIVIFIGGVFLAVGLLLAVVLPRSLGKETASFASAQGRVVAMVESPGDEYAEFRRPVVEFEAPNGELYRFTSSYASDPPAYAAGDTVVVRYDPANPREAELESTGPSMANTLRTIGIIFMLIGLATYGVAALVNRLLKGA
jgi:hypothetical protein